MDCNSCKEKKQQAEPVSFLAYESMKSTMERTIKRLWILAIILIILLAGTNAAWIYYEAQFTDEVITQEVSQESDTGSNHFIGGDYYGTANSTDNQENPHP